MAAVRCGFDVDTQQPSAFIRTSLYDDPSSGNSLEY